MGQRMVRTDDMGRRVGRFRPARGRQPVLHRAGWFCTCGEKILVIFWTWRTVFAGPLAPRFRRDTPVRFWVCATFRSALRSECINHRLVFAPHLDNLEFSLSSSSPRPPSPTSAGIGQSPSIGNHDCLGVTICINLGAPAQHSQDQ